MTEQQGIEVDMQDTTARLATVTIGTEDPDNSPSATVPFAHLDEVDATWFDHHERVASVCEMILTRDCSEATVKDDIMSKAHQAVAAFRESFAAAENCKQRVGMQLSAQEDEAQASTSDAGTQSAAADVLSAIDEGEGGHSLLPAYANFMTEAEKHTFHRYNTAMMEWRDAIRGAEATGQVPKPAADTLVYVLSLANTQMANDPTTSVCPRSSGELKWYESILDSISKTRDDLLNMGATDETVELIHEYHAARGDASEEPTRMRVLLALYHGVGNTMNREDQLRFSQGSQPMLGERSYRLSKLLKQAEDLAVELEHNQRRIVHQKKPYFTYPELTEEEREIRRKALSDMYTNFIDRTDLHSEISEPAHAHIDTLLTLSKRVVLNDLRDGIAHEISKHKWLHNAIGEEASLFQEAVLRNPVYLACRGYALEPSKIIEASSLGQLDEDVGQSATGLVRRVNERFL